MKAILRLSVDLIKRILYNAAVDKFSALAAPIRRQIIELLARRGELSASEISNSFPVSPPAISQHLKILQEARLVTVEKRAQQRIYRLNSQALLELEDWAGRLTQLMTRRFDALNEIVESEKSKRSGETDEEE